MSKSIVDSVPADLTKYAKANQRPFQEVLQYYGLERFLYRLSCSTHKNNFILKGALMLRVWGAPTSRPTRGIDFLGFGSNEFRSKKLCEIGLKSQERALTGPSIPIYDNVRKLEELPFLTGGRIQWFDRSILITNGELVPGMSGAPLLDLATGALYGMSTRTMGFYDKGAKNYSMAFAWPGAMAAKRLNEGTTPSF